MVVTVTVTVSMSVAIARSVLVGMLVTDRVGDSIRSYLLCTHLAGSCYFDDGVDAITKQQPSFITLKLMRIEDPWCLGVSHLRLRPPDCRPRRIPGYDNA